MNKKIATEIAIGTVMIIAIVVGGVFWLGNNKAQAPTQNIPEQKACTEEAKLCDDGVTYVGRTGPNCEFAACPVNDEANDKIVVSAPIANAEIASPVTVAGRARGTWFFEGSFPVEVYDGNNKLLGSAAINFAPKSATGTWMTEDFVDFSGSVKFSQSSTANGFMIFKKDNPSDLPTLEESFRIPIKFSGSAQASGLSWRSYENNELGFSLGFPETWKGYVVTGRKLDWGSNGTSDSLDFGFPAQRDGLFNISFHTKKQYDAIVASGVPFGQKLGENNGYIIVWNQAQYAANAEMGKRMKEIKSIIETFQLIVDKG